MRAYYETELGKLYHGENFDISCSIYNYDFMYTDPPYNCGKDYGIFNDNLPEEDYLTKFSIVARWCDRFIIHIPKRYLQKLIPLMPKGNMLIIKRQCAGSLLLPNKWRDDYDVLWSRGVTKWRKTPSNIWEDVKLKGQGFLTPENTYGHPGYTPISIAKTAIVYMTVAGEIVFDPHMGTGTTAVAAEQLNRRWVGIEISEKYCEIAAKRIENERKQGKLF